eukprot:CAMPEP_0172535934 /NCGR_PEP_ID=MMETSP1067-20121228/7758_1 /TAXON_ID=265564 ORGANISM="Thalassiosira punctigera, Strain Tpunct2005C2" /NCGR_SAMPLE_ID=MMETSP1067 /ASSEMBLY_ACC=CAM_ASM_000444 /LENGTH=76 /DNA_ID=CAMNT_0013320903 /DNA_START=47 /DNA_END=273 /DNA_ORIENTATION=+
MASSAETYSDFERLYDAHLSKVRSLLAKPADSSDLTSCEEALKSAKQCVSAMQGLAAIEGDPFKAEEAKRRLEREV